jgi:hypothetical protein
MQASKNYPTKFASMDLFYDASAFLSLKQHLIEIIYNEGASTMSA